LVNVYFWQILREALNNNAQVLSFGLKESSLEDILLRLVQNDTVG